MSLPSDAAVSRLLGYLIAEYEARPAPLVEVADLKRACGLDDAEYQSMVQHFHPLRVIHVLGAERLEIDPIVLKYRPRLGHCTFNDATQFFRSLRSSRRRGQLLRIIAAAARAKQEPVITLQAVLQFGSRVDDGRLVEAVAIPWFEIMKMIKADPDSIYSINPYTWEEIIAGAYKQAGFDEVILTPRSGDKGRDVVATKHGVGSVRFFDQVKAYKPGHLVTAEEVRAMVGTITAAGNVSKGIVTTTSDFAPRITEVDYVRSLVPYRLELKNRGALLPWLQRLAAGDGWLPADSTEVLPPPESSDSPRK
jgi:restriction system protein